MRAGIAIGHGRFHHTFPLQAESRRNRGVVVNVHGEEEVVWRQPDGSPIVCEEKLKVLNENLDEVRQICQDALEDAVLMGCDEYQIRHILRLVVESLVNPFAGR